MIYIVDPENICMKCSVCGSGESVKNIIFRYVGTNSGSSIRLCPECRKELIDELKSVKE